MNATPRTDDVTVTTDWLSGKPIVTADFARQLETELSEMTATAKRLSEALDDANALSMAWAHSYALQMRSDEPHPKHQKMLEANKAALTEAREKGLL